MRLHRPIPTRAPLPQASETIPPESRESSFSRSFCPSSSTTTMASTAFSLRIAASDLCPLSEISSGEERTPSPHDCRIYSTDPWPLELCGCLPARPDRDRLMSGSCSSARGFAPHFLPTVGHPSAVALRFARCGQLAGGLAPPRARSCRARKKRAPSRRPSTVCPNC